MSSIGNIGGFGSGAEQANLWIQGVARGGLQSVGKMPEDGESRQNRMMERIESLAQEAGLDSNTIASLKEELQSAISTALAGANETNGSSDPRQAVHSAVQSTLEKYGIDAQQLVPGQPGGGQDPMKEHIDSLARDAGLDSDTIASLHNQLQEAISNAIAQAKESGESNDPHQAVQAAVQTVLEKYGIDATQLTPPPPSARFNTGGRQSEQQNLATLGMPYAASNDPGQGVAASLLELLQVVDETA